jgi:hypothetical protein
MCLLLKSTLTHVYDYNQNTLYAFGFGYLFFLLADEVAIVKFETVYNHSVRSSLNSFQVDFNCKLWRNSQY